MEISKRYYEKANLETNLAYIIANTAMLYIRDAEKYLRVLGKGWKQERKHAFGEFIRKVRGLKDWEDKIIDKDVAESARKADSHDDFRDDSYKIARLVLLWSEKCARNPDNEEKIMQYISSLPDSIGVVTEDDLGNFVMR